MKISDFPSVQTLLPNNIFLLDGPEGTKHITTHDLRKSLLDPVVVNNLTTSLAGYILDARQGKILNDKFGGYSLATTTDGKIGYKKDGADTVYPFSSGDIDKERLLEALQYSGLGLTEDSTAEEIYAALASLFPAIYSLLIPGWVASGAAVYTEHCDTDYVEFFITTTKKAGCTMYYDSPTFDIDAYKDLTLVGTLKEGWAGSSYKWYIYLVNYADQTDIITVYSSSGEGRSVIQNINKIFDVSQYKGTYYLRLKTYISIDKNTNAVIGAKSYMNLTKIDLSV